jgi:hypothetical protein
MSDERDKMGEPEAEDVEAHKLSRMGEAEDKRDKIAATDDGDDVEAHKMNRMGEAEDKIAATDEGGDDVEGHMLGQKHSSGKMSS